MTSLYRPLRVLIGALFISTLMVAGSVRGAPAESIIYVNHDAVGNNDGSSWNDAYTDLQDGLGTAQSGDEIWVAQGVYHPAPDATDRTAIFELQDGVGLYGGFAGSETERHQRDWEANVTVLSGDLDRNDTTDDNDVVANPDGILGRNAYHVVMADGVGDTTVLDGFTVTAGLADGADEHRCGGGMRNIDGSKLTLTSVTFSGNQAVYGGGMYNRHGHSTLTNVNFTNNSAEWSGGGMYNGSSSPTLTNVTFSGNYATWYGGGMHNHESSPTLTDVAFSANHATDYAGGMCNDHSSPTLANVTFNGNQADHHGGGMFNFAESSRPTLTNVTFSDNHAAESGGGMANYESSPMVTNVTFNGNRSRVGGGMHSYKGSPTLANVTFSGNHATWHGGGMYNYQSSPTLTQVNFSGNHADYYGGGLGNDNSSPTLTRVTLTANQAGGGGGMLNYNGIPVVTSAIFSGNYAHHFGGGMYNQEANISLVNVTLAGNRAGSRGGGLYNEDSSPIVSNSVVWGNTAPVDAQMHSVGVSIPYVLYSDIEGGYVGEGNIDADPLFMAPVSPGQAPTTTGDYRLSPTSTAVDRGNNYLVTVDKDLGGNPRIVDGTGDGNAVVDMGAYESQVAFLTIITDGQGRATSEPGPIDCGSVCTGGFLAGTEVALTATVDPGWTFMGWSGDVDSTDNPLLLTIQDDTELTATFTQDEYTLDVTIVGEGDVDIDPEQDTYRYGDVVTLTATADPGWTFAAWSGDVESTVNRLDFVVEADTVITATFTQHEYTLDVAIIGEGDVGVDSEQETYVYGDVVTLTATAEPGWSFDSWSGDVDSTDNPLELTIEGETSLTATFTEDEYTLDVAIVGEGSVQVEPEQNNYNYGDVVTLTATAEAGWSFVDWSGDVESTDKPLVLSIQDDTALVATFAQDQYTLTVSIVGEGSVEVEADKEKYVYGDEVTLTPAADPGWTFDDWSGPDAGDLSDNSDGTWTLVMDSDKSLTATFTQDEYTLDVAIVGEGEVAINPEQDTYVYGDVVTLTATADPGWTFAAWSGDVESPDNPLDFVVEGNTVITATFTEEYKKVYLPLVLANH